MVILTSLGVITQEPHDFNRVECQILTGGDNVAKYDIFYEVVPTAEEEASSPNTYYQTDPNKSFVSLRTCTPTGLNSHRLILTGEKVDFDGGMDMLPESSRVVTPFEIILFVLFLVALVLFVYSLKKKR